MARGVNKVILLGNLGADPETRYTAGGAAVTNLSIATTRQWRDRNTNENKEETEWHRVVFFGRQAEVAGEYLSKGSQCYVEGRLRTRKWQDNNGNDKWTTEIVGDDLQLLGGRGGGGGSAPFGQSGGGRSQQNPNQNSNQNNQNNQGMPPMDDDFDDDIPF